MQPFYQGKIDNFCAIYAVLNALQIAHDIPPRKAREIFNEVLVDAARQEPYFRAVLNHKTDYVAMVDHTLSLARLHYPLRVEPHMPPHTPSREVWAALAHFARPEQRRTAVLRFCRYVPLRLAPLVDHWTTALSLDDTGLHLFDSSLEPEGVYCLRADSVVDQPVSPGREYFVVPPECVRLISVP